MKSGSREAVDLAISHGATIAARDLDGSSLLTITEKRHDNDIARYLIQRGADTHESLGKNKRSLLHLAASKGNFGFACVLVEAGLSPDVLDARGKTPLHSVTKTGNEYFVRYLLEHKADPNLVARNGDSALHLVARAGNIPIIQLLIRKGALAQTNGKRRTPFQEAIKCGQLEAAELLKQLSSMTTGAITQLTSDKSEQLPSAEMVAESICQNASEQVPQSLITPITTLRGS